MKAKWTARLAIQIVCGIVTLFVAGKLLPDRAKPENFKVAGVVLTGMATFLVIADAFFNGATKKLDEPVAMPSFTIQQKKVFRAELRRLEISLTVSFYIAVLAKGIFGVIGVLFTMQLLPDVALCSRMFLTGFFLLGFALPTIVLMPSAYFAAKAARAELVDMEEEAVLKAKLLESLQSEPAHDFANDPHFVAFGRVINTGE